MTYQSRADLGGLDGFGTIVPEPEGELFHADWEPRVLALTLAMGASGSWSIDASRAARETLPDYRRLDYYQIWFGALERLLAERGLVDPAELAAGRMLRPPAPLPRVPDADELCAALARGTPALRSIATPARYAVGDRVRTRSGDVDHHSRLPGYAQGRSGVIERLHGAHVYPDTNAHGLGEQPQWLYSVVFDATELWGSAATAGVHVALDAWESYLAPEAAMAADG